MRSSREAPHPSSPQTNEIDPAGQALRGDQYTPLIDDIIIDHGPNEMLAQFMLEAYAECRRAGIWLSFASFETLLEANQANPDSWLPLVSIFDHRIAELNDDNSYCIVGRNDDGEIVYTRAARVYEVPPDGPDGNFLKFVESMRHIYEDPSEAFERGERWLPRDEAAEAMAKLSGRIVFSGGVWCHPSYRKLGFTLPASLVGRSYSYAKWGYDHTVTFMANGLVQKGHAKRAGYTKSAAMVDALNITLGDVEFAFLWTDANEVLQLVENALGSISPEVDRMVIGRHR